MFLSTRRKRALAWTLSGGVIVTVVLCYYLVLPYYRSQVSGMHLSFEGLGSAIYDKTQGRNLRVLIVHGIGQHCIGYSDRLTRGILEWVDTPVSPAIDGHLEKLRDRVQEEALAFVERYRVPGKLPEGADRDLALHLGVLADRIAAGDLPLADERKDPVGGKRELERQRESKTAKDLELFVRYGLIDSACRRLPLPQSVEPPDFDSVSENLARINTCAAISRFAHTEGSIDCDRLTLDFYDGSQLMALAMNNIDLPKVSPPRCPETSPAPQDIRCAKVAPVDLGFLLSRTVRLPQENGTVRLVRLYELTWDPATRWAKEQYTSHDQEFDRDLVNQHLKMRVINDSISDAVMYLGTSRPLIQYPLLSSLCKILTDSLEAEAVDVPTAPLVDDEFRCARADLTAANGQAFADANELVILTHSLGTRVVLDTLGLLAQLQHRDALLNTLAEDLRMNQAYISPQEVIKISNHFESMRIALMGSLRKIFVLTNQIPLLEMASLGGPFLSQLPVLDLRDIGRDFDRFLEARAGIAGEPLQLVAFTDPNDLLSYSLRCWYQRYVLRGTPEVKNQLDKLKEIDPDFTRVFLKAIATCRPAESDDEMIASAVRAVWRQVEHKLRVAEVSLQLRSIRLPGIFTDPAGVHSNYFDDDLVNRLIACGAEDGGRGALSCGGSTGESK